MSAIYDPIQFISNVEILTITIIGSYITMKLLNALYENIYEPCIDLVINCGRTDQYYIQIGDYYVPAGLVIKEFIKWFLLVIVLMIIYNVLVNRRKSEK